jgi:hypothetical protein
MQQCGVMLVVATLLTDWVSASAAVIAAIAAVAPALASAYKKKLFVPSGPFDISRASE